MTDFNEWLTAKGFDATTLSDTQRSALETAWRAEQASTDIDETTPTVPAATGSDVTAGFDSIIKAQRAENARVEEITRLIAKAVETNPNNVDACEKIGRQAIEQKWPVNKAELELLRAARPGSVGIYVKSEPEISGRILEAAVCKAGGLRDLEKEYDVRTLEASDRLFRNGVGLSDLVMTFAKKNGYRSASASLKNNLHGALKAAFADSGDQYGFAAGGGAGTHTLPQILSNVSNKFLKQAFNAVDAAWREFSAIRSVTDFKQTTTIALTGDAQYTQVPPGGVLTHGSLGERYYTNQADTYGKLLGIDRRDLINDDLGALTGASTKLGRGAALSFNNKFWTVFLDNSTFFTSGNNNVSTGGGSALGTADGAAINAAELKFINQTDPDGKPLGVMPAIMLVPPTLKNTAARWMGSQLMVGSSALGDSNVYAGRFRVVSSPYMENSSYTGYSAAAWYLLADPNDMPVIEAVFLNGQQTPTVETSELDWNTLGIAMRGYFDYGVALQEFRGGVRSAGS